MVPRFRHLVGLVLSISVGFGNIVPVAAAGTQPTSPAHMEQGHANDPMLAIVSIGDQNISIYKGLELINREPISSGKPGHDTPTGIFSILEKRRKHFSNLYNNAPMPFMQRLTWSGIALHAGRLPGYPASHGCIRLDKAFAKDLFAMTPRGMHVIVTDAGARPFTIRHATLFNRVPKDGLAAQPVADASAARLTEVAGLSLRGAIPTADHHTRHMARPSANVPKPKAWRGASDAPLRILITLRKGRDRLRDIQTLLNTLGYNAGSVDGSMGPRTAKALASFQRDAGLVATGTISADTVAALYAASEKPAPLDGHIYVRQNFRPVFDAPVGLKDAQKPLGTHILTAMESPEGANPLTWVAVTAQSGNDGILSTALDRIVIPAAVRAEIDARVRPGASLIVTDESFRRHTTLGTGFVVETSHE